MPSVVAVEGVLGIQLVHCGTLFGPKINPRQPMIDARQPTGNLGAMLGRLGSSWVVLGRLGGAIAEFLDQLTPKTLILTTVSRFSHCFTQKPLKTIHLGAILDRLGAVLGPSWGVLGLSWGCLGDVLGCLGPS